MTQDTIDVSILKAAQTEVQRLRKQMERTATLNQQFQSAGDKLNAGVETIVDLGKQVVSLSSNLENLCQEISSLNPGEIRQLLQVLSDKQMAGALKRIDAIEGRLNNIERHQSKHQNMLKVTNALVIAAVAAAVAAAVLPFL